MFDRMQVMDVDLLGVWFVCSIASGELWDPLVLYSFLFFHEGWVERVLK